MHLIYLLFLLLTATAVHARQFGADWMTAPSPADSSCFWFRRTFVAGNAATCPVRASVSIATDSRFVLYVNGRNVSTALYSNATPAAITYDVTHFLRPDSNTVAVLVAPSVSNALAVEFFGTNASHDAFAYSSADGWLCHAASTSITAGGELMDGRADALPPAYGDMVVAQWHPVAVVAQPSLHHLVVSSSSHTLSAESLFGYNPLGYNLLTDNCAYVHSTLLPRYFDTDGRSVTYDFSPGFHGIVRVTLRGCRRGECISIGGNLTYVCSGDIDEQAYCRFSTQYASKITIFGDRWFRPEQVQEVEAICVYCPFRSLQIPCSGATR